jgi:hypothetical protein
MQRTSVGKKSTKGLPTTANFLQVLVDDEEATLVELNGICGEDQHIFSEVRIPKRILLVSTNLAKKQEEGIVEVE